MSRYCVIKKRKEKNYRSVIMNMKDNVAKGSVSGIKFFIIKGEVSERIFKDLIEPYVRIDKKIKE